MLEGSKKHVLFRAPNGEKIRGKFSGLAKLVKLVTWPFIYKWVAS